MQSRARMMALAARGILWAWVGMWLPGCGQAPPEIWIDVSPVNVGIRSTDPDLGALHFDVQLYNRGEETLVIETVAVRGDQRCAFDWQGPDVLELPQDGSAFIRGFYKPLEEGEDQVALIIVSNSSVNDPLVVPVCGKGVAPGVESAEGVACQLPPEDQPDCVAGAYAAP